MIPRFLLDTHIVVRWFTAPKKLSRDQDRMLREAVRRHEQVAISAMTLLEIAVLFDEGIARSGLSARTFIKDLDSHPSIRVLPLTAEIAIEVAAMGDSLRDPADRAIVATARVHGLQLVTSDQRIIHSGLVPVIE